MLSFSGTSMPIEKYQPNQVHLNVLYNLLRIHIKPHRDKSFSYSITELGDRPPVKSFTFLREDNVLIKYFYTIQDTATKYQPYPLLSDWLDVFVDSYKKNPEKKAIYLAPLVYVENQRNHFTTLFIYIDEKSKVHAYIIEPRANNKVGIFQVADYPVSGLEKLLNEKLLQLNQVTKVSVSNCLVGKQEFSDDVTCGPNHISFVEDISQLPASIFDNPQKIISALKLTSIARRLSDNEIYKIMGELSEAIELGRLNRINRAMVNVTNAIPPVASESEALKGLSVVKTISTVSNGSLKSPRNSLELDDDFHHVEILDSDKNVELLALIDHIRKASKSQEIQRIMIEILLLDLYKLSNQDNLIFENALVNLLDVKVENDSLSKYKGDDLKKHKLALFNDRIELQRCFADNFQFQNMYDVIFSLNTNDIKQALSYLELILDTPLVSPSSLLDEAIQKINQYVESSSLLSLSTFFSSSATNDVSKTKKAFIIDMLKMVQSQQNEDTKQICIAAEWIFNNYLAIKNENSKLRFHLELALTVLLRCDRQHQLKDKFDLTTLFSSRIALHNLISYPDSKEIIHFTGEASRLEQITSEEPSELQANLLNNLEKDFKSRLKSILPNPQNEARTSTRLSG